MYRDFILQDQLLRIFSEEETDEQMGPALRKTGIKILYRIDMATLQWLEDGQMLSQADILLCSEGVLSERQEVGEGNFYREFFSFLQDESVVLLAHDEQILEKLEDVVMTENPRLRILAKKVVSDTEDPEGVVNWINNYVPKAVLCALDTPLQEKVLLSHKDFMNTTWALGLGTLAPIVYDATPKSQTQADQNIRNWIEMQKQ